MIKRYPQFSKTEWEILKPISITHFQMDFREMSENGCSGFQSDFRKMRLFTFSKKSKIGPNLKMSVLFSSRILGKCSYLHFLQFSTSFHLQSDFGEMQLFIPTRKIMGVLFCRRILEKYSYFLFPVIFSFQICW